MRETHHEGPSCGFPKTLLEFEERFETEESCRAYLAVCRWNGRPRCYRCDSSHLWCERRCTLYERAVCGHRAGLTSGTSFHGTRKPLRLWFRAIWEISVRRHGISAAYLQRVQSLGSYEIAWAWAHRIRRAVVWENQEGLQGCIQVHKTHVGGKNSDEAMVLVAGEEGGRVRFIHAPGNHEDCIKHDVDDTIEADATLKTDGHAAYHARSLTAREHEAKLQSSAKKRNDDHVRLCYWAAGL